MAGEPANFTLHTSHLTLYTLHSALYTVPSTLYVPHVTLHPPNFTLYTQHFTLHTLHFTLRSLDFTLYTLHSTLHTPHFTLYTWHSTLYTPCFTLQTLHSTLHTLHATFFYIPEPTVHWHCKRGNMYKTVQINSLRKSCCVTAFPCVSTSVPLTYVWAFGFVNCIDFFSEKYLHFLFLSPIFSLWFDIYLLELQHSLHSGFTHGFMQIHEKKQIHSCVSHSFGFIRMKSRWFGICAYLSIWCERSIQVLLCDSHASMFESSAFHVFHLVIYGIVFACNLVYW